MSEYAPKWLSMGTTQNVCQWPTVSFIVDKRQLHGHEGQNFSLLHNMEGISPQ
jgi:hypothetical protein